MRLSGLLNDACASSVLGGSGRWVLCAQALGPSGHLRATHSLAGPSPHPWPLPSPEGSPNLSLWPSHVAVSSEDRIRHARKALAVWKQALSFLNKIKKKKKKNSMTHKSKSF